MSRNVTEADVLAFLKRVGCLSLGEVEERLAALASVAEPAWGRAINDALEETVADRDSLPANHMARTMHDYKIAVLLELERRIQTLASPVQTSAAREQDVTTSNRLVGEGSGGGSGPAKPGSGFSDPSSDAAQVLAPVVAPIQSPQAPSEAVAWRKIGEDACARYVHWYSHGQSAHSGDMAYELVTAIRQMLAAAPSAGTPSQTEQDILHTMYNHSHNADGSERTEHCCGCWQIRYNGTGLFAFCNECNERRDINKEMTALSRSTAGTPEEQG